MAAPADIPLPERRAALSGVSIIFASSILFGAMAVFVRAAAREFGPLQTAFVRFAGSLIVLLVATRGQNLRPKPGNRWRLLQRGALGATSICFYFVAIERAGAGVATMIHCTYPVWTAFIASMFMAERLTRWAVAALAFNLVGVALVVAPTGSPLAGNAGPLFALIASVMAAGAVATARHLRGSEDASLITTYFMAVGMVITAPSLLLGLPSMTPHLAFALLGVILTSVAGQWLLHHGLGFTSATQGSLTAATSVVSAAVFETVFLGEHIRMESTLGALFMFAAVALALRRE